jgi:glycosyltransferase involved in cell wall biosynthesis
VRVLYLTEVFTTHDRRFIEALVGAGHSVVAASLEAGQQLPLPDNVSFVTSDREALQAAAASADVVHAGPLHTAGFVAANLNLRPLVAASWAHDVLLDAKRSSSARIAVEATLAHAAGLIVDSGVVEDAVRQLGYQGPVARFPWGIDLSTFRPGERTMALRHPTVICTRAWEPIYRVPLVIQAFAGLTGEAQLVLVNDGSQRNLVESLIIEHGIGNRTRLTGHVGEEEIADQLRNASVYVSASAVDGSSISMLQALATGLPIVATAHPSNGAWLDGLPGARLVKGESAHDWSAAIDWALGLHASWRDIVRSEHRRLAEEHADWNRHRQHLLQAYETAATIQ